MSDDDKFDNLVFACLALVPLSMIALLVFCIAYDNSDEQCRKMGAVKSVSTGQNTFCQKADGSLWALPQDR